MRRILIASAFLSTLAVSSTAFADEPAFPKYGELPTGTTTTPPRTPIKVSSIPSR